MQINSLTHVVSQVKCPTVKGLAVIKAFPRSREAMTTMYISRVIVKQGFCTPCVTEFYGNSFVWTSLSLPFREPVTVGLVIQNLP